ncbi:MAG: transcriptional repressor NrdR [Lentisphaeria bacterium]|nr:transcriptional repressor NrdR [Lentisphaeria bacterium]MBR7127016.1 transcriptional repressor NrdR [Lentisphaeria bacterium]
MKCPACGFLDDKVVDSRVIKDGAGVRRRRVCLNCSHRFSTYEGIIREELRVIKRNGVLEEFDKDKLRNGIANACYKRPVSSDQIDALVEELSSQIQKDFDKDIPSSDIGIYVMNALRRVDQVAYVRFASVYRKFKDVEEFIDEIRALND